MTISRKKFLDAMLTAGSLGAAFVVAFPLVRFITPPRRSSESGDWLDAGPLSDIPVGGSKTVMHSSGMPLILVHRAQDEVVALEKKCPHLGCMVELADGEMFCPCHGARFTLDGMRIFGPSPRDLKRFTVEVRSDGHVFIGKELAS